MPRLKIESETYRGETQIYSMRLPKSLVDQIDRVSQEKGKSRNEIFKIFMEFALQHLDQKTK